MQLFVGLLHVHHQVLVGLAGAHHRAGGDHVQDQLLCCAGLEPGGTGQYLGAAIHLNGKLCGLADGAADIAGNGGSVAAHALGVVQTAQHIGRAAGSGNAHHKVIRGQAVGFQILNSQLPAVLCALHSLDKGFFAAGDEPHHHLLRHTEGGRALGGIQHAQAAGGTGAHIEQPSAFFKGFCRPCHRLRDLRQALGNGQRYPGVLLVHDSHDLQRGHLVQLHRARVAGLGGHPTQIQTHILHLQFPPHPLRRDCDQSINFFKQNVHKKTILWYNVLCKHCF